MKRAASSLHASGDEHPAAENQNDDLLLVVDGGVPSELNDKVVSMNSPCAFDELNDVFVAAATFPVVCGFDCASDVRKLAGKHESLTFASMTKGVSSWQLLYDRRTWSVIKELKLEQVWPMRHFRVVDRYAAVCELKRYDREADAVSKKARSDAAQLAARIVMFKCIRGKAKCTRWCVNYETRRQIVAFICRYVAMDDMTTMVVGDLGMTPNSFMALAHMLPADVGFCNVPGSRMTFMYRSQPAGSWKHSVRDLAQCSRIMIVNVALSSSDAPQPAGKADEGATLTLLSRTQHMLKLLESDDGDNDNLCMNSLWHPIQNHAIDASGELAFKPMPVHQALQCFQDALQVLRAARIQVLRSRKAGTVPSSTLSKDEFRKAMAYSKNLFREQFMVNEDLQQLYARFKESPEEFTKKQKQQIRRVSRSAFRVWATKLVGDYTFFTTVMAHGFFEGRQRQQFVQALLHERKQKQRTSDDVHLARSDAAYEASDDAHLAGSSSASKDAPVQPDREQLGKAALLARLQYKHAEKRSSAAQKDPWLAMSKQDRQLMRDLHSGALLHRRQEADECYGQGRDVQTLTLG